jgi:hypothetical protein
MGQRTQLVASSARVLSHAESLALIQVFLNASLACIAHARELIPWRSPCFSTRCIDQIDFDSLCNGQTIYSSLHALASTETKTGQEVKVLIHGKDRRADQILDMLVSFLSHCFIAEV